VVREAFIAAKNRGVTVRLVTDKDSYPTEFPALEAAGIPVVQDSRSALMHDKFAIVDDSAVWTGSFNFTASAAFNQNNNVITLASTQLAANYAAEFREMFESRKFGPTSPKGVPFPTVALGAAKIDTLFAPEDAVGTRIAAEIRAAKASVKFLAFSFTHDAIGQAMLDAATAGVRVEGIVEKTSANSTGAEYPRLKAAGLDVRVDANPSFMHSKVVVIDGSTVITGSFNFSASADDSNDENVVVIKDAPDIAAAYSAEYARIRQTAIAAGN
jgi:phosphatidylserine/phosphatidylglycerophosphate/cardiolipin synthase-like enzyme